MFFTKFGQDLRWTLTRPDPSILLTYRKLEADPSLNRVLFDPTKRDFFDLKGKMEKFDIFIG